MATITSNTTQITVRLPNDRVAKLKAAAEAEHRTLAKQLEHMLAQAQKPAKGMFDG